LQPEEARMDKKTRILIVTDSPVMPTGLAETTRLIFSTLLDRFRDQYDLHQVGICHCYAVTQPRWPIYPTMAVKGPDKELRWMPEDRYGQKTFCKVLAKVQPDIVFGFGEPHRVKHLCAPPQGRRYKLVLYVNFDGLPVPSCYCDFLRHADLVFTKSEFAKNVLTATLPDLPREKLGYLYSPADTKRFAPISGAAKAALRRDLLPPWMKQDGFILGWVGRNQWRKQVWLLYKVIHYLRRGAYLVCEKCGRVSLFDWDPARQVFSEDDAEVAAVESRPGYSYRCCHQCGSTQVERAAPMEDAYLWLHMPEDEPEKDWPAQMLEQQFALRRDRDIFYTAGCASKAALPPDSMPALYNLWDALLYLSGGEGFGLPAWEAMCCGLPAAYTNYSSHAEFLGRGRAGLPVSGILQPERDSCIWRMIADVPQTIAAVRKLYFDRGLRAELSSNGRAFAERFAAEAQAERWHEIFQKVLLAEPK
jgi:glycosyltransferase involved in cell wall biosynthesis